MLALFGPTSLVAAEGCSSVSSGVYAAGEFTVSPRRRMPRSTMLSGESIREKQQRSRCSDLPSHYLSGCCPSGTLLLCIIFICIGFVYDFFGDDFLCDDRLALDWVTPNRKYRPTSMISSRVMIPIAPPATPGVFEIKRRCALPV